MFLLVLVGSGSMMAMLADEDPASPERPKLVHADSLVGLTVEGREVRELRGNVRIVQGEAFIDCRRAKWWEDEDKLILLGQVQIYDGKRTLKADRVDYDGEARRETATGRASFLSGERKVDARRLVYSQETETAEAYEDVVFTDFLERATLEGQEAIYLREPDYGRVTGTPKLVRVDSTSGEQLVVHGLIVEVWGGEDRVVISDSVRISKGDFSATCQRAEYRSKEESLLLEETPFVLHRNQEMRGERIDVSLEGIEFKGGVIRGDAEIVSVDTAFKDILTGQTITIEARADTIRKVIVEGQATSVYHVHDEERDEEGVNTVSGDRIVLEFDGEDLERVLVESDPGQCTGVYQAEANRSEDVNKELARETKQGTEQRKSGR